MHLNISPSGARLAEVRQAARLVLRPLPAEVAHDLLLALDEAVSNAVKHGSSGGGPVDVSIDYSEGWVELRVLDRGPTPAVPALPAGPPGPMALGGRGLWLIRQLCDEVRVEPAGSGTLLAIRRRTAPAGAHHGHVPGYPPGHEYHRRDQAQRDHTLDGYGWRPAARSHGPGQEPDGGRDGRGDLRGDVDGDDGQGGDALPGRRGWRRLGDAEQAERTRAAG